MEVEMERERGGVVEGLIEKAINSTASFVDFKILKTIKFVVKNSEFELRVANKTLLGNMKRDHSQVRYLSLLIIDELFMRSKLFRTLIVENMDQLLALSVGFRRNSPLPAPASVATVLRAKAIEFLEKWNTVYGIYYRPVRLGYEYLKNTLRYQFPNLQANAARIQQERREREMRTKEILLGKFENLKANFSSYKAEIHLTIDEIEECLDILTAKDESMQLGYLDDEEMEEFRSSELRQIRLDSIEEGKKIQETSENQVVFEALRELYKLLLTKHLVSVQEWISILIRVEVDDNRFRDSALKELIDFRNHLRSVIKKCEESGCSLPDSKNQDEEDIWEEEGPIKSVPTESSSSLTKQTKDPAVASTPIKAKGKGLDASSSGKQKGKTKIGSENGSDPMRSKLLADAPVVEWGTFVHNWDTNRDFMANQRGMELDNHWGRVDYDAVIPADKIAELNVQATLYKEEPVEIQPCRAPLSKGGLCQRKDLRVCPFHGPIIPRDDEGNPIKQASPVKEEEINSDYDTLIKELAKKAVNNVRESDIQEAKKRENEKKALKRAKLAKVREHNDAILRDAAIASTSTSAAVGEDLSTNSGQRSSSNKKQTLASMLKKKVTPKDRLAQRLLNTRARNATARQVGSGEDANYREAFPNQW